MARGSRTGCKRSTRNKVQLKNKGSDESDEDYNVSEEGFDESEEDYCSSLADDESGESLGEFEEEEEEEEEEWLEKKVKKVTRPQVQKGFLGKKKNGVMRPRKKKVSYNEEEEDYEDVDFTTVQQNKKNKFSHKEEEDDDIDDFCFQEDDDFLDRKPINSRARLYGNDCDEKPRKKNKVSYNETEENSDYDNSDYDDDDEEFTPDEVDGLDDEEESPITKNRVCRPRMQKPHITKGKRRKRNPKVLKRTKTKKTAKEQVIRKKRRSDLDKEFRDDKHPPWKRTKITKQGRDRRRKVTVDSDSDFVNSGDDFEFSISEEEREQVREASEFCKRLSCSLRSSGPLNLIKEEEIVLSERKRPGRKGKEKVVEMKIEVGKQVCGICLSEEGKRTIRGILNCCSHYFCFACIMEWSKVESRCPLCKQRFTTISRTSRADGGHDLRDAVIAVPERDQVYQPSEEELRGYLDPYENVLCTECQHGGDDAHMLLCDLCDSPAHTYCVGLGHEVPDGNWYCDGCRPTALASQAQAPTADHRASNNSFVDSSSPVASSVRETFDLNEMYVPETPLASEPSPLPRHPTIDSQPFSPTYGSGAFTLFDRRRIQRQIHQLLNYRRSRQSDRSDAMTSVPSTALFGSQSVQDVSMAPRNTIMPVRAPPQRIFQQGRLPDYGTSLMYSREGISSSLRGQALCDQGSSSMGNDFFGLPHNEFSGMDARIVGGVSHQQLQPCNGRSNTGIAASISPFQFREATVPSRTLQGSPHAPL